MHKQRSQIFIKMMAIFLFLALGLALTGCGGGGGEAKAQGEWRIVTFRIADDSFYIRSATTMPTIDVINGTTVYEINAGGAFLEFTRTGVGGAAGIPNSQHPLEQGDQVIERQADGLITVIREI